MVNGRIVVYGSPSYLMKQYGQGYIFNTILNTATVNIEQAIRKIALKIP
jgi:hypothetical protein